MPLIHALQEYRYIPVLVPMSLETAKNYNERVKTLLGDLTAQDLRGKRLLIVGGKIWQSINAGTIKKILKAI